jgi:hypothetical protein
MHRPQSLKGRKSKGSRISRSYESEIFLEHVCSWHTLVIDALSSLSLNRFNYSRALRCLRRRFYSASDITFYEEENETPLYKTVLKPIWTYGIQLCGTAANVEILQRY